MGGGRSAFYPKTVKDNEGNTGYRNDGADLIKEWIVSKEAHGLVPKYVKNKEVSSFQIMSQVHENYQGEENSKTSVK